MRTINTLAIAVVVLMSATTTSRLAAAQRPSYAGARPTGGLSQKDKYRPTTSSTNSASSTGDVANRFGAPTENIATNKIPFGAAQSPPASGFPVVAPEPLYRPLPASQAPATPSVQVGNRFGGNGTNDGKIPYDAHGDRLLLDQLDKLPVDKRPFWYLNYLAIEAQRNSTAANVPVLGSPVSSFAGRGTTTQRA